MSLQEILQGKSETAGLGGALSRRWDIPPSLTDSQEEPVKSTEVIDASLILSVEARKSLRN